MLHMKTKVIALVNLVIKPSTYLETPIKEFGVYRPRHSEGSVPATAVCC